MTTIIPKKNLQYVALRQHALYIPEYNHHDAIPPSDETIQLLQTLYQHGFAVSPALCAALNQASQDTKQDIIQAVEYLLGRHLNWTPLVRGWLDPTNENHFTHFFTYLANVVGLKTKSSKRLPCGHIIPPHTFAIERYTGCPFCGTPFELNTLDLLQQNSNVRVLELWTSEQCEQYFDALLQSNVALHASQIDDLNILLQFLTPKADLHIEIKETAILLADYWIKQAQQYPDHAQAYYATAQGYLSTPNDILRLLWYRHTGYLQVIAPKILNQKSKRNHQHFDLAELSYPTAQAPTRVGKLKYSRQECRLIATWLNQLPLSTSAMAEIMHPKRRLWVRFIRALRLAEYAKRDGFQQLAQLLDIFYRQDYHVLQGQLDQAKKNKDLPQSLSLLSQRPGLFARSLFSYLAYFEGDEQILIAFANIMDRVPLRLLLTLNSYAEWYFSPNTTRSVKTILGTRQTIASNSYVKRLTHHQRQSLRQQIKELCLARISQHFAKQTIHLSAQEQPHSPQRIYIAPELHHIPLPIGERSQNIQDFAPTLMGEQFTINSNQIFLFMQWGAGLPAQHMDMDLSCSLVYQHRSRGNYCNYSRLTLPGCQHSGDIRSIPDQVGTAEYIRLDLDVLSKHQVQYVTFVCNAYSCGDLTANMVVGWMDSQYPIKVCEKTGMTYDPSCVSHQIRIRQQLQKGLIFGVLDVQQRKIIWLELPFQGQTITNINNKKEILALLEKINHKITIGELLTIKQQAQGLILTEQIQDADIVYDLAWARDFGQVNRLFSEA